MRVERSFREEIRSARLADERFFACVSSEINVLERHFMIRLKMWYVRKSEYNYKFIRSQIRTKILLYNIFSKCLNKHYYCL